VIEADVVVVGGGPAGAAAAITLAEAGREVLVLDKATFPRDKICGDALTTASLRILNRLQVDVPALPSWQATEDVVIRSPNGREERFALPRDMGVFAAATRRIELDAAILDRARRAGADVRDGHAVIATEADPEHRFVTIDAEGVGPIQAQWVIAADGMWSPVRKHLGLAIEGYRGEAHAFRQYFRHVGPRACSELFITFEEDLLPGYLWSFPLPGGGANVGFGIHRDRTGYTVREMAQVWPDLLQRPHIRAVLGDDAVAEGPHRAWPIPARIGRLALSGARGRVLFVGDAAAAVDVMSGEGIGQAMQTGIWAAEGIIADEGYPADTAHHYERKVHRELVADDRMSAALIRLLSSPRGARFAVAAAALSPWTRRNFVRWLFEDESRGVLLTPSRWHRDFLGRPGSYRDAVRPSS